MKGFSSKVALAAAAFVPAAAALARAPLFDDGAQDDAIVRALGLGTAGLPSLDALVAAPALILPVGTLVFRLALVSAIATGVASLALYVLVRRAVEVVAKDAPRALLLCVALAGALAATLSVPWQTEAALPLSSTLAAALTLSVLARLSSHAPRRELVVALALATSSVLAFHVVRRMHGVWITPPLSELAALFDRQRVASFLANDVGFVTSALAAVGMVVVVVRPGARIVGATAIALTFGTAVAVAFGPPASPRALGPEHYGTFALLLAAFVRAWAALATAALVVWVAKLRVPLASASASMVALLAAAFPAMAFDESALAAEARASMERLDWNEVVLGKLRARSLVVTQDPRIARRLYAAWLTGEAPEDLSVVSLSDVGGKLVRLELQRTPELVPLLRDVTLTGLPTELSMSKLAETRSLAFAFSERWDRSLARHLLPVGAFDSVEAEPRGSAERKRMLEAIDPSLVSLARGLANASATELAKTTALMLSARVVALDAVSERDLASMAATHVRAFSPDDAPPPVRRDAKKRIVASLRR